jgi:hypothetical protein
MSKIITDVSTYSTSVTVPEDGDDVTGSSVEVAVQSLANRTLFLKDGKDSSDSAITGILARMPAVDVSANLDADGGAVSLYSWSGGGASGTIGVWTLSTGDAIISIPCRVGRTYSSAFIASKTVGGSPSIASLYISRRNASGVVMQSQLSSSSATLAGTSWANNNYSFTPFVAVDGDFVQLAWSMDGGTAYPFLFLAAGLLSSY